MKAVLEAMLATADNFVRVLRPVYYMLCTVFGLFFLGYIFYRLNILFITIGLLVIAMIFSLATEVYLRIEEKKNGRNQ